MMIDKRFKIFTAEEALALFKATKIWAENQRFWYACKTKEEAKKHLEHDETLMVFLNMIAVRYPEWKALMKDMPEILDWKS